MVAAGAAAGLDFTEEGASGCWASAGRGQVAESSSHDVRRLPAARRTAAAAVFKIVLEPALRGAARFAILKMNFNFIIPN